MPVKFSACCDFRLPKRLNALEFVKKHGVIPSGLKRGRLSFKGRPHQKAVFEAVDCPGVKRIVLPWPSQIGGKSTVAVNLLKWHVFNRPTHLMYIHPNESGRNDFVEDRLTPAIKMDREWVDKLLTKRPSKDIIMKKVRFARMSAYMALAGSPADLAQRDCEFVIIDERDKAPDNVGGEGTVDQQATARGATFPNFILVIISKPTDACSGISVDYKKTNMSQFHVVCPKCGTPVKWRLRDLKWEPRPIEASGRKRSFADHAAAAKNGDVYVWYEMPCCGHVLVSDEEKNELNEDGYYVASKPLIRDAVGLEMNSFMVPERGFVDIAVEYMKSKHDKVFGDFRSTKSFFNDWMGLGWDPPALSHQAHVITDRVKGYDRGIVPTGCTTVTLGVDVQHDCVYWVALGWIPGLPVLRVVDWGRLDGEFEALSECGELAKLEDREWRSQDGGVFRPIMTGYDSGDGTMTFKIYAHCLRRMREGTWLRVRPVKGKGPVNKYFQLKRIERSEPHGGLLITMNSNLIKDAYSAWLGRDADSDGTVGFPVGVENDPEFIRQIISQERKEKVKPNGDTVVSWVVRDGFDADHWFDALMYAVGLGIVSKLWRVPKAKKAVKGEPGSGAPTRGARTSGDSGRTGRGARNGRGRRKA